MADLLWEIGTEELPAGALAPATASLAAAFQQECAALGIAPSAVRTDATPRRLALFAQGLPARQAAREVDVKGPAVTVAFGPDGKPTRAAEAFAAKNGVAVTALTTLTTDKGAWVMARRSEGGTAVADLLPGVCERALAAVHTPKTMTWGAPIPFARPIRSVCLLLDDQVVRATLGGCATDRTVRGHPFLSPGPVTLARGDWDAYRNALAGAKVVLETADRQLRVREAVEAILRAHGGPSARADDDLVAEVANLLEWPLAIEGKFDDAFLEVPAPVLEAAMTEHQRYFPVRNEDGALVARFVTVADRDGHADLIRTGNERVLRARLADARFFWKADRQKPLRDRVAALAAMGQQEGLGSLRDRAERLARTAARIASHPRAPALVRGLPPADVAQAARLAKADLTTQVVGEFPTLQGVMGAIYADLDGEARIVADAIREHYLPRGGGDPLPRGSLGILLAVADRALALVEGFALGREPTGSRDPFGLRRAAYGLLRLVREGLGAGKVSGLCWCAAQELPAGPLRQAAERRLPELAAFVAERLAQAARDAGHSHDRVRAVLAAGSDEPVEVFARLEALARLQAEPWFETVREVVSRTRRIVEAGTTPGAVDASLLREPDEQAVHAAVGRIAPYVTAAFAAREHVKGARHYLDALASPVHAFFEKVMVNVEDLAVRRNRMALMWQVHRLFVDGFADLSLLPPPGAPAEVAPAPRGEAR